VLDRGAPSTFDRNARRIARWLTTAGKWEVTRTEVRVQALGKTVNSARTEMLLRHLQSAGLVRLSVVPSDGGRPAQQWQVNPGLLGQ
jgi:hypothetical protein